MSDSKPADLGKMPWHDLTVDNAEAVANFYSQVTGLTLQKISMGDYSDYTLVHPTTGNAVAGICHARGPNKGIPPQWLTYMTVESVNESVATVKALGGQVLLGPKGVGKATMAIIQDPAGAVLALWTNGPSEAKKPENIPAKDA